MKTRKINFRNRSTQMTRQNGLKMWLLEYAFGFSGFGRIPIENLIRTEFGERYFSFSGTILTLLFYGLMPFISQAFFHNPFQDGPLISFWQLIWHHILLYIYLGIVFYFSLNRRKEIKELPSVYDFARYSKSNGLINKKLILFIFQGRYQTIREIETFWEPLVFFLPGLLLTFFGISLGYLLLFCSIVYSLGYCAAYYFGDQKMMDIIDETIVQEELMRAVVEGKDKSETRGYSFVGNVPNTRDDRQKVVNKMLDDDSFEDIN